MPALRGSRIAIAIFVAAMAAGMSYWLSKIWMRHSVLNRFTQQGGTALYLPSSKAYYLDAHSLSEIGDGEVSRLAGAVEIKSADLSRTAVTDAGVRKLLQSGNDWINLRLSGTAIGDGCLDVSQDHRALWYLDLSGTHSQSMACATSALSASTNSPFCRWMERLSTTRFSQL